MKTRKRKTFAIVLSLLIFVAMTTTWAEADTITFSRITANSSENVASQLFVDVTEYNPTTVQFRFYNTGPIASSITDIYFDDGALTSFSIATIYNQTGVDFSWGASPPDLPGGNNATPPFVATAFLTADSNPPTEANGINPFEELIMLFDGVTYGNVIADLADGDLRIGLHVQAIGDQSNSDSFVNDPPGGPVPEPTTILLLGSGLIGLAGYGRKKLFNK